MTYKIFVCLIVLVALASSIYGAANCPAEEEYYKCSLEKCYKTCKDARNPPPCPSIAAGCFQPSCECKGGRLRNDLGVCVEYEQCPPPDCPKGEVYSECGSSCPPSCKNKGNTCLVCTAQCVPGCYCAGKTIRAQDGTCVLPENCPAPKCTGPNEIFDKCPPTCPRTEKCSNLWSKEPCTEIDCCKPQCRCMPGFYRNDNNVCISAQECTNNQSCKDPNAERLECAPHPSCRSTCAKPNPSPCILSCAINQCVCKKGFVLSENGKCITVDQCPKDVPCNGDSNAVIKANPIPCPSTCSSPNANPWCERPSPPVGCECKPGYLLAQDGGKCIKPDECPGGNPCGVNATFVWCSVNCPTNNCPVSDTRAIVACSPPFPCPNGCACKLNYKRRSSTDNTCILATDCPPVKCTRPNEIWSPCPSACLSESCADVDNQPTACNTLVATQCQPRCICKKGHFRNDSDICVPARECPKPIQCKANEVYRTCRIICPPQTCASIYTDYDCRNATQCEPGCDCLPEYLRNGTEKDPCIPSNLCPINGGPSTPECGINEHYETDGTKCDLTCKNYDLGAQIGPCEPRSGCFCDDGYVRNSNGVCIPKKRCPKNIVCKKNEVLSECYNSCHKTCKTRIRGDGRMCSLACTDTGCLCVEGYLRHDNGTCVPISECSPPQCHANETYSSCGSACPPTYQNRGDNCTACTDQCVEDCFCCKGYLRADDGTCVKPKDCPPRTCNDPNEYFDECPPTCPPTDGCSNIWSKFNCTNAIQCCKPQCRCKSGYYRNNNGICIPIDQCIGSGN